MEVLSLKELSSFEEKTVVTDGGFDGIHVGHRTIISEAVKQASENGLKSALITFRRPPRLFFRPESGLLTTLEEKLELIEQLGIDFVLLLDVPEIKGLHAEDFVQDIIIDGINGQRLVIGFNHHFGRGGRGDAQLLIKNIERWRLFVTIVPPIFVNGFPVSSTLIRSLVSKGRVADAMLCLGRPYFLTGEVVRGMNVGQKIGFPTANLAVPSEKLLPSNGVYAAYTEVRGRKFPSAVFVGRPRTVRSDAGRSVEAHIIGFDGELYGEKIRINFIERIRDEKVFSSVNELRSQIAQDVELIKKILS